jgi:quinoprotein glucose dehydrogenase
MRFSLLLLLGAELCFAQATGNAARGKSIYEGVGQCATCHRINGSGSRMGPDLSDIAAAREPDYLQTALLDPDADVGYANRFVRIVTKSGQTLDALLLNQDLYTVQVIEPPGRLRSFNRSDLVEAKVQAKSAMPSYRGKLKPEELADVVAYLMTLKGVGK